MQMKDHKKMYEKYAIRLNKLLHIGRGGLSKECFGHAVIEKMLVRYIDPNTELAAWSDPIRLNMKKDNGFKFDIVYQYYNPHSSNHNFH
jgi:hypothetical protein